MIKIIFGFGFSVIEASVMLGVVGGVLSKRFSGFMKYILLFVSVVIGAIGINIIGGNIFTRDIILLILFGLLCYILYIGPLQVKVFYLLFARYICVVSEVILSNIVMILPEETITILLNNIVAETIVSILIRVLVILLGALFAYYINKLHPKLPAKYWMIMDVILIFIIEGLQAFTVIEMEFQKMKSDVLPYTFIINYAMLLVGIFIIYFLGKICWVHQQQTEYELAQLRGSELQKIVSYQKQTNNEMKKIRHDIKKHLTNVSYMLETKQFLEAKDYITNLIDVVDIAKKNVFSGNYILDVIINKHLALCESKQIKLDLVVDEIQDLNINPVDVSAIFDNLLDNAIEAIEQLSDELRYIIVKIFCYKDNITVVIKNPCTGVLKIKNGNIYTTKLEEENHGYGLRLASEAIEKNNGIIKCYLEDNLFTVVCMLPLKS